MAMLRSAFARIPRRRLAASSVMCRRGTEILQAPALPFLHPAAPLISHPGPAAQMMRNFTSPAAAPASAPASVALRTRGVSNLPGQEPDIPKGILSMDQVEKKGAELIESARRTAGRLKAWLNAPSDPLHEAVAAAFVSVVSVVTSAVTYHRMGSHRKSLGQSDSMMEMEAGTHPVWQSSV